MKNSIKIILGLSCFLSTAWVNAQEVAPGTGATGRTTILTVTNKCKHAPQVGCKEVRVNLDAAASDTTYSVKDFPLLEDKDFSMTVYVPNPKFTLEAHEPKDWNCPNPTQTVLKGTFRPHAICSSKSGGDVKVILQGDQDCQFVAGNEDTVCN